jgi:hypothetical protein
MAEAEFELDSNWKRKSNANLQVFMPRVNIKSEFDWQIWTFSTQNLKCHLEDEMCSWKFCTTLYWQIFCCLDKIWRTRPKFQNNTLTSRGLSPLARVLTKGSVFDLLKVLMGECWWGFRGDDPGWPFLNPSQQVWPAIKVNQKPRVSQPTPLSGISPRNSIQEKQGR